VELDFGGLTGYAVAKKCVSDTDDPSLLRASMHHPRSREQVEVRTPTDPKAPPVPYAVSFTDAVALLKTRMISPPG
jgi:hypothetical protein